MQSITIDKTLEFIGATTKELLTGQGAVANLQRFVSGNNNGKPIEDKEAGRAVLETIARFIPNDFAKYLQTLLSR
ncbi:MAG: hypothetical protein LW817_02910 [Candidatus Caenarcaniphilales bacterium]|nr:hypothetical protein [Candidatus Caenarcaniphilales bacterium]